MKKMTMMLAVLAGCLALTACGGESSTAGDSSSAAETTTSASDTTAETTTAAAETTASAADTTEAAADTTAAPSDTTAAPAADTTAAAQTETGGPTAAEAKALLEALNKVEKLGAAAVETDASASWKSESGEEYLKAAGSEFADTAAVKKFMEDNLTADFIAERYSGILGTDKPMCVDVDGALYIRNNPHGGGFAYKDAEPVIEKTMEDGYSVFQKYDDFGAENTLEIRVVETDGKWKITGASFGQ